jgi:hypothetical protein
MNEESTYTNEKLKFLNHDDGFTCQQYSAMKNRTAQPSNSWM